MTMYKLDERLLTDNRPVVAIDIDGVLNLYWGRSLEPGLRYRRRHVCGYRITWRADLLQVLQPLVDADARGEIQLAWGTMWEELAVQRFAPEVLDGLGTEWPVIYFNEHPDSNLDERMALQARNEATQGWRDVYFKTPAMAELSCELTRPILWIDDGASAADQTYLEMRALADGVETPVELLQVDARIGLTPSTVKYALLWLESQSVSA